MKTRCPQCHDEIEVLEDTGFEDLSCGNCGTCFNLRRADEALLDTGPIGQANVDTEHEMRTIIREPHAAADFHGDVTLDLPGDRIGLPDGHTEELAIDGDEITGYDLLGELGRGGMGVVYKARHRELKRIVALKVILSGFHASDEDMRRFKLEAESVAKLQHPNIVQIFEISEHQGRPYIALEFANGGSLQERISGKPQDAEESASLVESLAGAMQLAHENDIIHRDLKPANVLLTEEGTPRITDFGLAKRMDDDSNQTRSGSVLGTPSYMAPEQAGGESDSVGPSADIYALGAILYHMLTGRPPFQAASALDTVLLVIGEEPVAPSKLNPVLTVDLETICLKCLEKDAQRRYRTAAELGQDLNRYLAGEPILARPVNMVERSWKWAKRRPAVAGMISVSVTAILVLLVGGAWYNTQLENSLIVAKNARQDEADQRIIAENAQEIAETRRLEAMDNLRKARRVVDTALTGISEIIQFYPGVQRVREGLLKEVAKEYEEFASQQSDDFDIQLECGTAYLRLGEIRQTLGETELAEIAYQNANSIFEEMDTKFTDHPELDVMDATAKIKLVGLWETRGELVQARQLLEKTSAKLGTVRMLYPDRVDVAEIVGITMFNLSGLHLSEGNYPVAQESAVSALSFYEKALSENPDNERLQLGLANTLNVSGTIELDSGDLQEAFTRFDKGHAILGRLLKQSPDRPDYLQSQATLAILKGIAMRRLGNSQRELMAYEEALAAYRALGKALPDVPQFNEDTALTLTDMGQLYIQDMQLEKASVVLSEAYDMFKELALEHGEILRYVEEFAATGEAISRNRFYQGDRDRAIESITEANELFRKLSDAAPDIVQYRYRYALGLLQAADISSYSATADEYMEQASVAVKILEDLLNLSDGLAIYANSLAKAHSQIGDVLWEKGSAEQANSAWLTAKTLWQEIDLNSTAINIQYDFLVFIVENPALQLFDSDQVSAIASRVVDGTRDSANHLNVLGLLQQLNGKAENAQSIFGKAAKIQVGVNIYPLLGTLLVASSSGAQDAQIAAVKAILDWNSQHCPGNTRISRLIKRYTSHLQIALQ
jgi:serine/threonine protein kinase